MTDGFDRLLSTDLARFAFWAVDAMPAICLAFGATENSGAYLLDQGPTLEEIKRRQQAAIQQAQVAS